MIKTIIKEAGIVALLLVIVALLLTILLYEYIPNSKTVPIKIQAYTLPSDIDEELKSSIEEEENIVKSYFINSAKLDLYESTHDYNKGKANPFADYSQSTGSANNATNSTGNNSSGNSGNTQTDKTNTQQNEVYINTPGKNY